MTKKEQEGKKLAGKKVAEPAKTSSHTEEKRDWRAALKEFADGLKELYGPRLHSVILYGSRARGDAEPDSDIDVLVVLEELGDSWDEAKRMSPLATRMLIDHGALITVLPAAVRQLEESDSPLFANIRRDGVRVG